MNEEKKKGMLRSFPATFWIAILMKIFERGAYYGLNWSINLVLGIKLSVFFKDLSMLLPILCPLSVEP